MQPCNNKKMHLKKSSLAILTAIYVGATGYAAAEPSFKKVPNTSLHEPTISVADLQNLKAQKNQYDGPEAANLSADIGLLNKQYKNAQPQAVFTSAKASQGEQTYIVQFEDRPIASYEGGVHGYTATAQNTTRTFVGRSVLNMQAAEVKRYQHYLQNRQQAVVASAQSSGASIKISKQFTVANNAAVVRMTQADALLLAKQAGVKKITPNRILELQTDRGPEFIGADKVWSGEVTPQGVGSQGEGMVVGIIDTGINTDHIAFASDSQYEQMNPLGAGNFLGDCVEDATLCNDKLIGVRSYEEITKANSDYIFARDDRRPENGEDYNGHGSHTASTAAGNYLENTPLQQITGEKVSDGVDLPFNFPKTSGVAPRAHIVAYQVCYPGNADDPYVGCPESAILSAFEDAIADGVDVINFSIGGGESFPWDDPIELAFLNARKAGIHVAAAAGNSGPTYYTADHTSPWVTTVGAAYHDRVLSLGEKVLTDFQGTGVPAEEIVGKSYTGSITGQVVLAENYADPDETDEFDAQMCNAPFAEGTFTSDQIVVCLRGDAPRTDKAKNVAAGGAGGFILQNVDYNADDLVADQYVIPGIQITRSSRWKLRNWVNDNEEQAIATITAGENIYTTDAELGNQLVPFSSMGPSRYINNLVPDVAAPGVDIYAANADEQPFTNYPSASDWTMMSGTSMATPHVAGAMTLLASIHPEWTPAQLQSALMMTAKPVTIALATGIRAPYYTFMGGAGAIDVASAAQAGLIMDESIDNYIDANPNNGGLAEWLNVPSMVNMECELSCSWVRTVTATQDGTWKVDGRAWSAEGRSDEIGLSIDVQPKAFTLKAGESQDIHVTMNLPNVVEHKLDPTDEAAPWDMIQNQDVWFNGEVTFIDQEGDAPNAHLPIAARNHLDELPLSVDMEVARESGSETLLVNTDSYSQLTPRYYGLVAPTRETAIIEEVGPFVTKENVEKGWHIQSIDVPEGTKRLVVKNEQTHMLDDEVVVDPRYQKFFGHVMVGFDANENGSFMISDEEINEYAGALKDALYEEMVCYSSSMAELNYCNIVDPAPGKYWIATAMINAPSSDYEVTTHYAIVTDEDKGNLTVEGPASHDGNGNYALKVNWMMPESEVGETYYGGFDLGDMPGGEGSLGFTALNIHRDANVLTMDVDKDKARAMDVVDVNVKLKANFETDTRDYQMTLQVPEGLRLAEQTLQSNNEQVAELLKVEGNTITLNGSQLSTRNVQREYKLSSSLTDQMCRTPQIDEQSTGGYIDLFSEYGMQPNAEWMVGDAGDYEDVPIDWLFYKEGADFKVYNQPSINSMRMHAVGAIQTTPFSWVMSQHRGPGFLTEALAPFWRGSFEMDYLRHWEDPHGLTIATQYADERPDLGDLLFLEYDNVKDKETGDSYDFQAILRSGYDDHKNKFEIIYAYNNLGDNLAEGAIFVEGGDSNFSRTAGFKEGGLYTMVGYNTLDNVLEDDLVLCFDYVGPEQSEIEFSFKAAVKPDAKGTQQDITLNYQLGSATAKTMTHSIAVQSNLKVSALDDMTVAENGRIDGIEVMVLDADQSPNELVITGEGISAEVNGMSFNLIPDPHFFGETYVTVTVQDKADPTDKVSTEFMLTVVSDGIDAPATIVEIADKTVMEDGVLEAITVALSRETDEEFTLSVAADNATTTINGMEFSLKPDAGFYGEIPVVVTLTGTENVLTTEFMVTVTPSDLAIVELADMTVIENGKLEDINVALSRETDEEFTLSVTAQNAAVVVDGMSFSIEPTAHFFGNIPVMVTLTSGAKSLTTEFTLSVISDGIELGCTYPEATNFDPDANSDDGSCIYPEVEDEEDSGSFGYLMLLLLPLLNVRRRK
ncbi:S8 family serine peptidase [Pseudoalteromonas sp. KAN5]|uniref:S8 family serine peptidase n=1 Tax=Pseudoalteromonas sp. KAN5 TaxID=2916633 RepID=UPI002445F154|nr:S8 family serine peptidase [Pseudoalteromonas sp. KAN5]BDF96225.1 serine protease [Pseudoalteromonas sp. KAN5]